MAWKKRTDGNHVDITQALEKCGWTVVNLSRVGGGCPDILVGAGFQTVMAEIKTEKGSLNANQVHFHTRWMGSPILILRDPVQAVEAVQAELRLRRA